MSADETQFLQKEETPKPASSVTTTSTKIDSVETEMPGGKRVRQPGELLGMSGRWWVTMVGMVGATYVVILVVMSDLPGETKGIVIGGYLGMVNNLSGTYAGQNAGPSKSKPS